MPTKKFQRTIEDFICEHCGAQIKGDGYTNHCPHCLWSKHVDINPGDRAAICNGLMTPTGLELKNGKYIITQQCQRCGLKKKIKAAEADDFETILKLSAKAKID